jgi:outer membrane protein TolC
MAVRRIRASRVAAPAALLLALLPAAAGAGTTVSLGLRETVERARAGSHLVRAGDQEVAKAGEDLRKARSQRVLPEASLNFASGVVPEAHGNLIFSPDSSNDLRGLGPYYRVELKLVQPLWTFGKLDALERLAQRGVSTQEARRAVTAEGVGLDAVKAYWALAAAVKGEAVARDMRQDFEKLQREVEERIRSEKAGVSDADLLDVKSDGYAIDRTYYDSVELRLAASDALRALVDLPPGSEPVTRDEAPPAVALDAAGMEAFAARAVAGQRQVRALEEGVRALTAKVELERASRNPVLFLAAGAGYAHAGNRTEQDNPWANETFNYQRVGAEVGLRFDSDIFRGKYDVGAAEAERRALEEQLAAARELVTVEARHAYREAGRDRALLDSARAALKAAKSRLRLTLDNWETGIGEVHDVLDAYEKFYRLRAEEPQREYALNCALAALASVLGDINLYLEWVQHGNVSL